MILRFRAELWEHGGEASWFFLSLPQEDSDDLREQGRGERGFGSVRVRATVGATTWQTSAFPSKDGPYLLPVKKQVRRAEQLEVGEPVDVILELIDR